MVFIAGQVAEDEILCNCPPHTLRIDLQQRRWKSDVDSEAAIVDANGNGIPLSFILLGFTPFYGNLGMRHQEEFIRIAYIGVSPNHRLLPPRCVTSTVISGKTSQKGFISYFQTLYNNRINCASVVTTTKFVTKSFNERDPVTGADGAKINYNALEFSDRPAETEEEKKLIADVNEWLQSTGASSVANALRSTIPGSQLVELPLGEDHAKIKALFEANNALPAPSLAALPAEANPLTVKAEVAEETAPPSAEPKKKKAVELTPEQAKTLGIDF
jgi:hypothetical protein